MAKIENCFSQFKKFEKKTKSKFEKKFCYGVELLFFFDLSPNTTM